MSDYVIACQTTKEELKVKAINVKARVEALVGICINLDMSHLWRILSITGASVASAGFQNMKN